MAKKRKNKIIVKQSDYFTIETDKNERISVPTGIIDFSIPGVLSQPVEVILPKIEKPVEITAKLILKIISDDTWFSFNKSIEYLNTDLDEIISEGKQKCMQYSNIRRIPLNMVHFEILNEYNEIVYSSK
jgi:hypothetical protein